MSTPPPSLPGRYRPLTMLGEGATGEVYLCHDQVLGMDVALKVVRRNLALHRRFRARFAREVALSAQLVHPGFVPIHDHGQTTDGRPFVSMSYARRGNLGALIERGTSLWEVVQYLDEVLEALAVLHTRGLVHQDLKPQNVLLNPVPGGMEAWLSDLGEAHALALLAHDPRGVGGTPAYMSPEQLAQKPQEMGPWTDLYAVGIMLWEAVCGRPPHIVDDRRKLLLLRSLPPPTPVDPEGRPIPGALEEILENLLDPDPLQRYDLAADVRNALHQAMESVETDVRQRPLPGGRRDIRREPEEEQDDTSPFRARRGGGRFEGAGAMRWNMVPPAPLPPVPPPRRGGGATRASLSLLALRQLPLVGREEVRQILWDQARQVLDRQEPRVVVLVGESGAGKTRLVESTGRCLEEGGHMEVVRLRYHWPPGVDDGYRGAVMEMLSPWQDSREEFVARVTRLLSRDRRLPPDQVELEAHVLARWCGHSMPDEPAVNAAVGLAFLYRHLDARSWRGGSCLVLDDVHRAAMEGDGLAIAQSLLDRTVGERPVLVLATMAAESLQEREGLRHTLKQLESRGALVLNLPPLDLHDTRRLLDSVLPLQESLARDVADKCRGNPLAVSLLLREWAARKLLHLGDDGIFRLEPGVEREQALPRNTEQLYVRRLEAAVQASEDPAAAAEALAASAMAGQEPPTDVVREISEEGMDSLLSAGVLREVGATISFEHGSVQQTALRLALRLPDANRIHLALAEAWRGIGTVSGMSVTFPVGLHLLRGGDGPGAAEHLARALRTFIEEGRNGFAAWAAQLAHQAADTASPGLKQEIRRLNAEALVELRRYQEAERLLREALTLEPLDRVMRARLNLLLSRSTMGRGDLDSCRRFLDNAAGEFEALGDREGARDVAHGRGALERLEGRPGEAVAHFTEALRLVRKDPRREVAFLAGLVEAMLTTGNPQVHRYRKRMMEVSRESGDTRNIAQAAYTSALVYLDRRQLAQAERHLHTAIALSATLGAHWLHLNCQNTLGEVARFRGDTAQARKHYEYYSIYAEEQGLLNAAAVGRINLALLALQDHDSDGVDLHLLDAERVLADQPRHWTWVFVGILRADMAARKRDEARTRAWWSVAKEHGLANLRTPDLWLPLQRLVESASAAGYADIGRRAWQMARELGHWTDRVDVVDHEDAVEIELEDPPDPDGSP